MRHVCISRRIVAFALAVIGLIAFAGTVASAQTAPGQNLGEALRTACSQGDVASVRRLLAHGADPNARDGWRTPLNLAAQAGRNDILALLRAHGARWSAPNEVLSIAAASHRPATVSFLLARGAPLDARGAAGKRLLAAAARYNSPELAAALLDRGVPINVVAPGEQAPPLHIAVRARNWNCSRLLLRRGAAFDLKAPDGTTPLMAAADSGAEGTMRVLLARGADPNAIDAAGWNVLGHAAGNSNQGPFLLIYYGATPLFRKGAEAPPRAIPGFTRLIAASRIGDFARVRALVRAGAPLKADGSEVLTAAAGRGDLATVRLLIARGVPLHSPPQDNGMGPGTEALGAAARAGHADVVRLLLAKGSPWPQSDGTPGPQAEFRPLLVDVAAAGHTEVMRLLLAAGFDPTPASGYFITDGNNHLSYTPLLAAAANGRQDVAGLLLNRGIKVNEVYTWDVREHRTALTVAAQSGNTAMVRYLLRRGADPRLSADGKTPAQFAREAGHPATAALLEQASRNGQ